MQLHHDAKLGIALTQSQQNDGLEAFHFLGGELFTTQTLLINSVCLRYGIVPERNIVKAMVRCLAAALMEVLQARNQCVQQVLHGGKALLTNRRSQKRQIFLPAILMDIHCAVGAVRGADHHFNGLVSSNFFMPLQGVDGVISSTDKGNICLADQTSCTHLGVIAQHIVALIPNALGTLGGEGLSNTEELLQFQMAPVVHGIADGHLQCFHKLHKTLEIGLGAGNIILRGSVGAHYSPLIVVTGEAAVGLQTSQPNLRQVFKTAILINLSGIQMAVVVHQRQLFCVIVEQMPCGRGFQKEILIHKCLHNRAPLHIFLILL